MPVHPKRKVTYSLPGELVAAIADVVRDGAAPSYSAFVEEALREGVRNARERALARAFSEAAEDPDFLTDVNETLRAFRHVDREADEENE
jgi:Arc/MetJ-type ribon-helix-helix transcriptional regulator